MGSPQYGQLVLDGRPLTGALSIEPCSLCWSDDGALLAAQELVDWTDGPITRVVVFDTKRLTQIAASPDRAGLGNPDRFEGSSLVYRHWHHEAGERGFRLEL